MASGRNMRSILTNLWIVCVMVRIKEQQGLYTPKKLFRTVHFTSL